jgi:hypothetical protein
VDGVRGGNPDEAPLAARQVWKREQDALTVVYVEDLQQTVREINSHRLPSRPSRSTW